MKAIGTVPVLRTLTRVYLARPEESDGELDKHEAGSYCAETGRILVNNDATEVTRVRDTIVHEVEHVMFDVSGARHFLRTKLTQLGCNETDYDAVEETLVRMLSPALSSCIDVLAKVVDEKRLSCHLKGQK